MKFKTDENLPEEAASILRESGFDADSVRSESLGGADDQTVMDRVRREGRILLTLDLDFANIRAYPPGQHPGIVVLRLKGQDKETVAAYTRRVAAFVSQRNPAGELWVVERDRIRFRQGT